MKSNETSPSAPVLKKSQPEEFDLVILDGGTGSTIAAWTFAGEGKRVAVVDRKYIGGSCPSPAPATCIRRCPLLGEHLTRYTSSQQDAVMFMNVGDVTRYHTTRINSERLDLIKTY